MKAYITTHALTDGILEVEAIASEYYATMISYFTKRGHITHCHKPDWFFTLDEAKNRAEIMRQKAIESAKKKIYKLENLKIKEIKING